MVLESGQITLSMDNIGHTICKWRAEQMVSQWMLTPNCWICQQRMACDDLRSCKSGHQKLRGSYVQVDRSTEAASSSAKSLFQAGEHTHLGLFHCFLFSLLSLFPILLALHHFLMLLACFQSFFFSSDLDVLEARSSLDSYTGDFWHWKPYMQKDFNVKRHKNKGKRKEQGINGVITAWWGQKHKRVSGVRRFSLELKRFVH